MVLLVSCVNTVSCDNTVLEELLSPNGKMKVVVFSRECGATTGFNKQISVLSVNEKLPDDGGNIFIVDDNNEAVFDKEPGILVKWIGDERLSIKYNKDLQIFYKITSHNGVFIEYIEESRANSP